MSEAFNTTDEWTEAVIQAYIKAIDLVNDLMDVDPVTAIQASEIAGKRLRAKWRLPDE